MTMTTDEYTRWQFEQKLVTQLLGHVERAERGILRAIGCPADVAALYTILNGEQRAPWPARLSSRARQQARDAMHVLVHIAATRTHLALGHENARLAAHEALLAGLYAGDAALNAVMAASFRLKQRKAGEGRGRGKTATAQQHDKKIATLIRRWNMSDELQDQSLVAYVRQQTKLQTRTIQRAIRRLTRQ
jgi:hypothetical protein